jgi:hypothetical protein
MQTEGDRFRLWADSLLGAGFQVGGGDLSTITMHSCTEKQIKDMVACLKRQKTGNYITITEIYEEILCHLLLSSPKPKTFSASILASKSKIATGGMRLFTSIQRLTSRFLKLSIGKASLLSWKPSSKEHAPPV